MAGGVFAWFFVSVLAAADLVPTNTMHLLQAVQTKQGDKRPHSSAGRVVALNSTSGAPNTHRNAATGCPVDNCNSSTHTSPLQPTLSFTRCLFLHPARAAEVSML